MIRPPAGLLLATFAAACAPGPADCPCGDCGVDLQNDPDHCGACGRSCRLPHADGACAAGRCRVLACEAGHIDADGRANNGCETPVATAPPPGDAGPEEGPPAGAVDPCGCAAARADDPGRAWLCHASGAACERGECTPGYTEDQNGRCAWGELRCDGIDDDGDGRIDDDRCEARIPGGVPYTRGVIEGQAHTLQLPYDFAYDTFEVPVHAYHRCLLGGGCSEVPACGYDAATAPEDDLPVRCVSWCAAWDYCRWVGKRLPTDAESAYVVRGQDGRFYPWGAGCPAAGDECWVTNSGAPPCLRDPPAPDPVEAYSERRRTDFGLLNIYGNVTEWLFDPCLRYDFRRTEGDLLTGGVKGQGRCRTDDTSFLPTAVWQQVDNPKGFLAWKRFEDVGLRCARTLGPVAGRSADTLPPPLRPGSEEDVDTPSCARPDICGPAISPGWRSLERLQVVAGAMPNIPSAIRAFIVGQVQGSVGLHEQPFVHHPAAEPPLLGMAARPDTCDPLAWPAQAAPVPLVPHPDCERCWTTAAAEPVRLATPETELHWGELRGIFRYEEVKDIELAIVQAPISQFIRPEHTDVDQDADGVPDAFSFAVTYEGFERAPERTPTECTGL